MVKLICRVSDTILWVVLRIAGICLSTARVFRQTLPAAEGSRSTLRYSDTDSQCFETEPLREGSTKRLTAASPRLPRRYRKVSQ